MTEKINKPPFDGLDYKIIQQLQADARADATKIARAVDAHERTVRKRIERLIESGAIHPAVIVNPRAFGYVTAVNATLEVASALEEEVIQRFLEMSEIAYLAYGLDDRNTLLIQAHFKDNDGARKFLQHTLPSISGVKTSTSILVSRILHDIDGWMPKPEDFQ
jgi:DNA-binding Lrp family transcriptional regulator